MRRRTIAALAVFVPMIAVIGVQYFYPRAWRILDGYMLVIALIFKGALLSFWAASKLKFLAFLKGLTFLQGLYLLIKRWFLDNVFARWLKRNVTDHFTEGFGELKRFYSALNFRAKFRNILLPLILGGGSLTLLYYTGYLDKILLFTELKVLVISLSKTLLMVLGKVFGFMFDSWITPILEVFALSYFFTWLEEKLGRDNIVIRALNALGRQFNRMVFLLSGLNRRYIDPLLNDRVSEGSRRLSDSLQTYVRDKKIAYEYDQFDRFERQLLGAHIDTYHHFKGMERITDKRTLYSLINQHTDDNLEIVGFLSRNANGELLPENAEDSYYHDVFLLEGFASSHRHGVMTELASDPDHSDFWVLNTSAYPLILRSHSGYVPPVLIAPQSLVLILTEHPQDYADGDIYGEFRGRTGAVVPIEPKR
jgi:hypothetical protein